MLPLLISNSFPFSLVRRSVLVEPRGIEDLRAAMRERPWVSAWGHANTVGLASEIAGTDLRPGRERPALELATDGLPSLDGQSFAECWLLSPDYVPGFRPAIGEEVSPERILGWQVLRLTWLPKTAEQTIEEET